MYPTTEEIKQFITLQHPSEYRISQGFGENKYRKLVNGKWLGYKELFGIDGHNGIDYACPIGSCVYAPCRLEISNFYKENKNAGYGTTIWGRSEPFEIRGIIYRLEIPFGHLSKFNNIKLRQWFNRGDVIGFSGNTGAYTSGPHLHAGMVRLLQKTWIGGWKIINKNNGYNGYFDPTLLINKKLNLVRYDGKLVYSEGKQDGKKHYFVKNGELQWIQNEIEFFIAGFNFKDAVPINANLINISEKITYKIDWLDTRTLQAKKLVGFAVENPTKAKKYFNELFN